MNRRRNSRNIKQKRWNIHMDRWRNHAKLTPCCDVNHLHKSTRVTRDCSGPHVVRQENRALIVSRRENLSARGMLSSGSNKLKQREIYINPPISLMSWFGSWYFTFSQSKLSDLLLLQEKSPGPLSFLISLRQVEWKLDEVMIPLNTGSNSLCKGLSF